MARQWNYKGIIPALALPLKADYSVDEADLRRLTSWLAMHKGISALMTNGHTGDVFSLTLKERVEVTRIVADELKGKLPVISAVTAEGIHEAVEQAMLQKEAGASGKIEEDGLGGPEPRSVGLRGENIGVEVHP